MESNINERIKDIGEMKTFMNSAINNFFDTKDKNVVDCFYESSFTFSFYDKYKHQEKTIQIDMYPETWETIEMFLDDLNETLKEISKECDEDERINN